MQKNVRINTNQNNLQYYVKKKRHLIHTEIFRVRPLFHLFKVKKFIKIHEYTFKFVE